MTEQNTMVVIEMITYNHEAYIRQAIESVLAQETNFPYCLYIFEDCSTDNTANICLEYKNKYPDKIRLNINKVNLGIKANARILHEASYNSGAKYIAMCEGDDYWMDPRKLQKQVDFLENNHDFSVCFHRVYEVIAEKLTLTDSHYLNEERVYALKDLADGNIIPTVSVVFRNNFADNCPEWIWESPIGDYALHMYNGQFGLYKCFSEPMAAYRHHGGGMHSMKNLEFKAFTLIEAINVMQVHFSSEIRERLQRQKDRCHEALIRSAFAEKNFEKAKEYISLAIADNPSTTERLVYEIYPEIIQAIYNTRRYKTGDRIADIVKRIGFKI